MKSQKFSCEDEIIDNSEIFIDKIKIPHPIARAMVSKLVGKANVPLNVYFQNNSFSIIIIISGEITLETNFTTSIASSEGAVLIAPNSPTKIIKASPDIKLLYINYSDLFSFGNIYNLIPNTFFINQAAIVLPLDENKKKKIIAITELLSNDEMFNFSTIIDLELINCILKLLVYDVGLIYKENTSQIATSTRRLELNFKFIDLLRRNFKKERTVDFYADQLYLSKSHFTRVIIEFTGKTPNRIIDEMILNESRILLTSTSFTINEIAMQLNFKDQSNFGKFFKNNIGISPKAYRNTNQLL